MPSQINKWGNSAAIRIPANILADAGLSIHSHVNIQSIDGRIVIEPAEPVKQPFKLPISEETLLQGLNEFNSHADEVADVLHSEWAE